jgi:hypothetical protein
METVEHRQETRQSNESMHPLLWQHQESYIHPVVLTERNKDEEGKTRPPLWSSGQSSWLLNGYVLCFLWGTNWIYICYVEESRPPLWSSGQSSWLLNGYVLCFLWGTKWIYICYVEESRPPVWSSGQSSWLLNGDVLCFMRGTKWIYMLCRRK